jgi:hypothetical protein
MGFQDGQLPIPGDAIADPQSVEMIRAWIANRGLHCSLNIGIWGADGSMDERRAWGILLADVVKHVADALVGEGLDKNETVAKVRESFLAELDKPTSSSQGGFVDEPSRN